MTILNGPDPDKRFEGILGQARIPGAEGRNGRPNMPELDDARGHLANLLAADQSPEKDDQSRSVA